MLAVSSSSSLSTTFDRRAEDINFSTALRECAANCVSENVPEVLSDASVSRVPAAAEPDTSSESVLPPETGSVPVDYHAFVDGQQSAIEASPVDESSGKTRRKRRRRPKEKIDDDIAENIIKRRRARKKQFDIDAGDKVFTDNFDEVCKCECKYCGKVQTMDEFRVHLRVVHSETIHDYRQKFGEMDFVSLTYHR